MTTASRLLHAQHLGIRELKAHLSKRLKGSRPIIVTEYGIPTRVILSYRDVLELIDILDELQDQKALELVREGRDAIRKGVRGIPVSRLFNRLRLAA